MYLLSSVVNCPRVRPPTARETSPSPLSPPGSSIVRRRIDQDGLLPGSDDVAQVEVGGLQGVEQGQVGPLPPVEALNFGSRRHGRGLGPGHPAIRSAVKQWRRRQGGFQAAVGLVMLTQWVAFHVLMQGLAGASPGKFLLGLRVVKPDGQFAGATRGRRRTPARSSWAWASATW